MSNIIFISGNARSGTTIFGHYLSTKFNVFFAGEVLTNREFHLSKKLLENGIYAVGFFYPVVPKNKARIRLQINSEHTKEELDKVIDTFKKVGEELNLL